MKSGPKPKDSVVKDGFNTEKKGTTVSDLDRAKRQSLLVARKLKREADARKKLERDIRAAQKKGTLVPGMEPPPQKVIPDDPKDKDDQKSAHQMLADLRYAYRNAVGPGGKKGKARLLELMKSDSEFKFMVKELTKVESALISASIRKEGPSVQDNRMVFVILKGLEEDQKLLEASGGDVDVKQVTSVLNPDGSEHGGML